MEADSDRTSSHEDNVASEQPTENSNFEDTVSEDDIVPKILVPPVPDVPRRSTKHRPI